MINKQTIISAYDEKLTLVQWLKSVNKALDEAVLTNVEIAQRGNATFVFVFTFEDGTQVESNEIIINQGESINGASIRNGHLYLTLTNGDELDAGNVKPVTSFSIDASQHLIVHYGDGTTQDLGAIFSGNVNIDGNFTANSIIENMSGYSLIVATPPSEYNITYNYFGVVKNGNKLSIVFDFNLTLTSLYENYRRMFRLTIPSSVGSKLYTMAGGDILDQKVILCKEAGVSILNAKQIIAWTQKESNTLLDFYINSTPLESNIDYHIRYEVTFLLSDSLLPSD